MEVQPLRFEVLLTSEDLSLLRDAILKWGKPVALAQHFDGADLHRHFARWEQLVGTAWSDWDISEYDHDLGCRMWIQVAIEHSSPATAQRLREVVEPLDERFRSQMKPRRAVKRYQVPVLRESPYFWETHAVHPELT